MQWASSISVSSNPDENIRHCVDDIRNQLKSPPDIALLFATSHFSRDYERIQSAFYDQLSCKTLIGCSAGGIIGEGKEAEGMPGISLIEGRKGIRIRPKCGPFLFHREAPGFGICGGAALLLPGKRAGSLRSSEP